MQFQRKIGPEQHTVLAKIFRCGIALILMAAFVFALLLCAQPVGKLLMPPVKYYSNETDAIEYGGGDIFVSVDKIRSFDVYADVTNNSDTAIMLRGSMVQKNVDGKWLSIRIPFDVPADDAADGNGRGKIASGETVNICADSAESLGLFALGRFRIVVIFELKDILYYVYSEF